MKQSIFKKSAIDAALESGRYGQFQSLQAIAGPGMDAGGTASSGAFLVGELEKQDPRLIEP